LGSEKECANSTDELEIGNEENICRWNEKNGGQAGG